MINKQKALQMASNADTEIIGYSKDKTIARIDTVHENQAPQLHINCPIAEFHRIQHILTIQRA